jgi:hypothetical protein
MMTTTTAPDAVLRLHKPTAEEFDARVVRAGVPAVLTGCLEACRLLDDLRAAADPVAQVRMLAGLIGRRKVHYTTIPPEQGGQLGYGDDGATNFSFSTGKRKVPFQTFADVLSQTLAADGRRGNVYMQSVPTGRFPELAPRLPALPYLRDGAQGYSQLWIGSGGHVVNLHFDPAHNLVALLAGRKRFTIVRPDNMSNLYPAPLDARLGDTVGSRVKLLDPDFDRFPRAAGELAKRQTVELEPGDLFYLPPMWWHHVESFGLNVMVNTWVLPISGNHFMDLTANLVRGLLLFHSVDDQLRSDYRPRYHALLTGAALEPAGAGAGGPDGAWRARVMRHMDDTVRVTAGVPDCLRTTLPQLYDYYLFHVAGPPALSRSDPAPYLRRLRWYARVTGALGLFRRLATRPARAALTL